MNALLKEVFSGSAPFELFCTNYNRLAEVAKMDEKGQKEYKALRRKQANEKKVVWEVTNVEDFKSRLGQRWKSHIVNFAKLIRYAEEQLKHSMINPATKQKWLLSEEPSISLSFDHLSLQSEFADENITVSDYSKTILTKRVENALKAALKSNLLAIVDNTYSYKHMVVNFTKLYKFNPNLIQFCLDTVDQLSDDKKLTLTNLNLTSPSFGSREFLEGFFGVYKLDKFRTPVKLEHSPEFIREVVTAKYAPLIIYPQYDGDGYMDTYDLTYKVHVNNGMLTGISAREWTPFTRTTKERKDGMLYRPDICREYFGDKCYDWDVNGSIYRANAALNGKKLDKDVDVYKQMWIGNEDIDWEGSTIRSGYKQICMSAFMTRSANDFIFGIRNAYKKTFGTTLTTSAENNLKEVWDNMRKVIGESYRTEALFVAGALEKIVKFALARTFRERVLQCYDCFYSGSFNTAAEAKRIYFEVLGNEEGMQVCRDVINGKVPTTTLQEVFKDII